MYKSPTPWMSHTQQRWPLLTQLKPGPIRIIKQGGEEEILYVSGGYLEVQPNLVTLLADTAVRAKDVDEAAALEAQKEAEKALANKTGEFEYSRAAAELADWQLQADGRQGEILLGLGLAQRLHALQSLPPARLPEALRRREAMLRLVDPAGLGEFRWLLYGAGLEPSRFSFSVPQDNTESRPG